MKVDNAYAPVSWFYRVNSVFYDPSIYGRFLVVAILASLVARPVRPRRPIAWLAAALAAATLIGLLPSFSQSSFVALAVGIAAGADRALAPPRDPAARARRARARRPSPLGVPQLRHRMLGKAGLSSRDERPLDARLDRDRSSRSTIPLIGVGTGGFRDAYAKETHKAGRASHDAADHGRRRDRPAGARGARLARSRCVVHRPVPPQPRHDADRTRPARLRSSLARDRRAQPLLQRADRGPALLGAARPVGRGAARAGATRDRRLAARARARSAHRRRRVRLRRHDGAARRGGRRGPLRRVLDRDPLAARGLPAGHAPARGRRRDRRARDSRPST